MHNHDKSNESGMSPLMQDNSMETGGKVDNGKQDHAGSNERDGTAAEPDKKAIKVPAGESMDIMQSIYDKMILLRDTMHTKEARKEEDEKVAEEWALVSAVTDRFFLIVFLTVTLFIMVKVFA